jgi:hypothetical protein
VSDKKSRQSSTLLLLLVSVLAARPKLILRYDANLVPLLAANESAQFESDDDRLFSSHHVFRGAALPTAPVSVLFVFFIGTRDFLSKHTEVLGNLKELLSLRSRVEVLVFSIGSCVGESIRDPKR